MIFDPMSVKVTCVTLPKDHCVQVPWQCINVCGYSDQICKMTTYYIHTTYRISDHIVSYWTQFRRDKKLLFQRWGRCTYYLWWVFSLVCFHLLQLLLMIKVPEKKKIWTSDYGGKSPVGAYKRVEALQFFHAFKTILIVSLRRDEMLTWLIFHLFGNLSDTNWWQF